MTIETRVKSMLSALAMACGGSSQVSAQTVAFALAGQINNAGMCDTAEMQHYDNAQAAAFAARIEAAIIMAASLYDENTDEDSTAEIRAAFYSVYSIPSAYVRFVGDDE